MADEPLAPTISDKLGRRTVPDYQGGQKTAPGKRSRNPGAGRLCARCVSNPRVLILVLSNRQGKGADRETPPGDAHPRGERAARYVASPRLAILGQRQGRDGRWATGQRSMRGTSRLWEKCRGF
jgi:hypothetical protein